MPLRPPLPPAPLPVAIAQALPLRQQGFGLLSIIITAALGAAVLGVVYATYEHASVSADAAAAAKEAAELGQRVRASYAATGSFDALSTTSALHDGIYPKSMLGPNGRPVNPWHGSIQLAGETTRFALTFEKVPPEACLRFVTAAANGWTDIEVNGASVLQEHTLQIETAATLCAAQPDGAMVQFWGTKAASLGATPALSACVVIPPQTQKVNCPAGQLSSVAPYSTQGVTQSRSSMCVSAYGLPAWTPWTTTSNTCVPSCASKLAVLSPNPATQTQTVPDSLACPPGQSGSDTWTQQQTHSRTAACAGPSPISDPTWSAWSAWTNTGPRIGEVNTCAPTCATRLTTAPWLPNPATQTRTISGSAPCPSGQTVGSDTWTQPQTQTRAATCANPDAAVDPVWSSWSAWVNGPRIGEVNTCAVPPPPPPPPAPTPAPAPAPAPALSYVSTSAGCSYNSYSSGGVGATGECVTMSGTTVGVTSSNFWDAWDSAWDANIPNKSSVCDEHELVDKYFYNNDDGCLEDTYSPAPPATCSTPGQKYYSGAISTRLDCGQSGQIQDCGTDDSQNYTVYICQ